MVKLSNVGLWALVIICFALFSISLYTKDTAASSLDDLMSGSNDECVNAYYGIGEALDYTKAYKCFASLNIYQYMIVMQLNGEGVPANPKKAKELLDAWLKADPDNARSADETQMESVVEQRLNSAYVTAPKLDYCKDVAGTTYSMDFCAGVNDRMEQHNYDATMNSIRAGLNTKQAAIWDQIQVVFAEYQKAEGERLFQQYADGTIRTAVYEGQISYVRANFLKLMQDVFVAKSLAPASTEESKKLEAELKSAYQADVDKYADGQSYLNGIDSSADDKKRYADNIAEYKSDVENSQSTWYKLRDLCASLASGVYQKKGVDWSSSMTIAMTKIRVLDIQNDPDGPGQNE